MKTGRLATRMGLGSGGQPRATVRCDASTRNRLTSPNRPLATFRTRSPLTIAASGARQRDCLLCDKRRSFGAFALLCVVVQRAAAGPSRHPSVGSWLYSDVPRRAGQRHAMICLRWPVATQCPRQNIAPRSSCQHLGSHDSHALVRGGQSGRERRCPDAVPRPLSHRSDDRSLTIVEVDLVKCFGSLKWSANWEAHTEFRPWGRR